MAPPEASGIVERPVKTLSPYKKTGTATLRIHTWTQEQRSKRAMKRLAFCWGLALFAALIPPHIPWLVTMLVAGPIAALLASRQSATILDNVLPCPDCGAQVELEEQAERWPLAARCKACGNIFSIEQA